MSAGRTRAPGGDPGGDETPATPPAWLRDPAPEHRQDPAFVYRRFASRALALALSSPFEETRQQFLELAQQFETLAAHVEFCARRDT